MSSNIKKVDILNRVIAKLFDLLVFALLFKIIPEIGFLTGLLYILVSDGLSSGKSPGKGLLGLWTIKYQEADKSSVDGSCDAEVAEQDGEQSGQPHQDEASVNVDMVGEAALQETKEKISDEPSEDDRTDADEAASVPESEESAELEPCTFTESIIRNAPIAFGLLLLCSKHLFIELLGVAIFGFEYLLILGNNKGLRLGDVLARTLVQCKAGSRP